MNGNYVKIFRKFENWEWYKDTNTKTLFIHFLLKANWKEGNFKGIKVPRGSFITSLQSLSDETGLTIQQIRTSIKHLISTSEITSKIYPKFRLITIKNYNLYQDTNKVDNKQLTSNQQATNNNRRSKEVKKERSVCNTQPTLTDILLFFEELGYEKNDGYCEYFKSYCDRKGWQENWKEYFKNRWCKEDEEIGKIKKRQKKKYMYRDENGNIVEEWR